ncbi:hypothetical protein GTP45_25575 [Pseudoduganella sp. FT55W]|uniref:Uncharacterized protein n=1 Tax=Duganella rivi TaxID=2666083 RepID=A0A7X4KF54_9BURK|nr:hypothetical protein [Duganella rivi]MYM70148.1 hypothetical protein [Duganella rivi]
MKKYLYAGLLAVSIAGPALAAAPKFVPQSPEEPLHRRAILVCMAVVVGLQAYRHRPRVKRDELPTYHN